MSSRDVSLQGVSVFIDFDGTISTFDTGTHLLQRLAKDGWQDWGRRYRAGLIDSRTCLTGEWDMLPHDLARLTEVAAEVPLDPAFGELLDLLLAGGADVAVLSDGFGFYVRDFLDDRAPVITNEVRDGRLVFPPAATDCPCGGCGVCKRSIVAQASAAGRITVVVGDGTSDRAAAEAADLVFATGELADWCSDRGIAHHRFRGLAEVVRDLSGALERASTRVTAGSSEGKRG